MIGVEATITKFDALGTRLKRKVLVRAGNAASRVLLKAVKAATPVDRDADFAPGLLRKSMGRSVKVYAAKGIMWFGVGPQMKYRVEGPPRTKGKRAGQVRRKIPYLYGRVANARGGRWMDAAVEAAKSQVFGALQDVLSEELARL